MSHTLLVCHCQGTLEDKDSFKQLIIEFPYSNLKVEGITSSFDQDKEIS